MQFYLCVQHKIKIYPASNMVDQVTTKEEISNRAHGEKTNKRKVTLVNKAFKKKGSGTIIRVRSMMGFWSY